MKMGTKSQNETKDRPKNSRRDIVSILAGFAVFGVCAGCVLFIMFLMGWPQFMQDFKEHIYVDLRLIQTGIEHIGSYTCEYYNYDQSRDGEEAYIVHFKDTDHMEEQIAKECGQHGDEGWNVFPLPDVIRAECCETGDLNHVPRFEDGYWCFINCDPLKRIPLLEMEAHGMMESTKYTLLVYDKESRLLYLINWMQ